MRLYPAIDILGGRAVRLTQGEFGSAKVYDSSPLAAAQGWVRDGARRLHVVDLDGARAGAPQNLQHLREIAGQLDVPVQFGGGLRSEQAVRDALAAGAQRVILGTAAFSDPALLGAALQEHGPARVMVSVDVRGGAVAIDGWTNSAAVPVAEVFDQLADRGVEHIAYTNVDRDGMLDGPNREDLLWVSRAAGERRLTYSGGIGELGHLRALAQLGAPNLEGVIVGKALYERRFTIAEAMAALGDAPGEPSPT